MGTCLGLERQTKAGRVSKETPQEGTERVCDGTQQREGYPLLIMEGFLETWGWSLTALMMHTVWYPAGTQERFA